MFFDKLKKLLIPPDNIDAVAIEKILSWWKNITTLNFQMTTFALLQLMVQVRLMNLLVYIRR